MLRLHFTSKTNINQFEPGYLDLYKRCLRLAHPNIIKEEFDGVIGMTHRNVHSVFEEIFYSLRDRIPINKIYCNPDYKSKYPFRIYDSTIDRAEKEAQFEAFFAWKAPVNNRKRERLMRRREANADERSMYDCSDLHYDDDDDFYDDEYESMLSQNYKMREFSEEDYYNGRDLDDPEILDCYETEDEDYGDFKFT